METQRTRISISNFRISKPLQEKLKEKGIEYLLPIQARTFDTILDGSDLVGRARTGQGKTLAFVLPILESLTNGPAKASRKAGLGRSPSVLVLVPTRELASQVHYASSGRGNRFSAGSSKWGFWKYSSGGGRGRGGDRW